MEDYQKRVVEEKEELDLRASKLCSFMNLGQFLALPADDQSLLEIQYELMSKYRAILQARIDRFDK